MKIRKYLCPILKHKYRLMGVGIYNDNNRFKPPEGCFVPNTEYGCVFCGRGKYPISKDWVKDYRGTIETEIWYIIENKKCTRKQHDYIAYLLKEYAKSIKNKLPNITTCETIVNARNEYNAWLIWAQNYKDKLQEILDILMNKQIGPIHVHVCAMILRFSEFKIDLLDHWIGQLNNAESKVKNKIKKLGNNIDRNQI